MSSRNEISRITIDMPTPDHKRLKAVAALTGKSMKEMVLEFIDSGLSRYQEGERCQFGHIPNEETAKVLKAKKKDLVKMKSVDDFFKKFGI